MRPPTYALHSTAESTLHRQRTQLTSSLNFFIGSARTVCEAGLALKTHGSLVKGLTPLRAACAGFFLSFMFRAPANLKFPVFFSWAAARDMKASATSLTLRALRPVFSATAE